MRLDVYGGPSSLLANVHAKAFPGFFLTRMGPRFLAGYYDCVRHYPKGIVIGAEDENRLVGFVAGFIHPSAFYIHLGRNRWRLLPAILFAILKRPGLAIGALRNSRRVATLAEGDESDQYMAELSSIGVDPATAGRGTGGRLVREFCSRAVEMGARRVVLTTDRDDNDRVRSFYERLGFEISGRFMQGRGRRMLSYEWCPGGSSGATASDQSPTKP